jgi:hypothetical protein
MLAAAAADFLARVLPSSNRHSIVRVPAGIHAVSKRPAGRRRVTGRLLRSFPARLARRGAHKHEALGWGATHHRPFGADHPRECSGRKS